MSAEDLNKEYSPSCWTKRFKTSEEVLKHHVKVVKEETQRNLERYNCKRNIRYGGREMERMDIYFNTEEGSPIVVYIHGGYWQELTKNQSAYCVSPLIESGCRVIVLDYDLCPSVRLEEIVQQIRGAMKFIFKYADSSNAQSVSIVGHSAGAHLAASVLQEEYSKDIPSLDKLVSVFLISGVYDLTDLRRTTVNRNNVLSLDGSNVILCSPIFHCYKHLRPLNVKLYVYVAENDSPTFIKQSENFHLHLLCNKLESELRIVPDCDHFDVVENLAQNDFEITRKIVEQLASDEVGSLQLK